MPVVEVEDLEKSYGSVRAVAGVTFSVEEGEVFGILGPNGAGKTTTVECIEGLIRADRGRISVFGLDPRKDEQELRKVLGVQLQESRLPDKLRVREALELYASFYADPEPTERLLQRFGLSDKRRSMFGSLSGGQQQRVSIALALVGRPKIAILDELTTGLDPRARRDTWQLIRELRDDGVTVLLVTHFMDEAEELCDRLALINAGNLVAVDTPAGFISRVGDGQRIVFRPSRPFDERKLSDRPGVTSVTRDGQRLVVTGSGNLLHIVSSTLQELDVTPVDLRMQQASLDDAFLSLTGRSLEADTSDEGEHTT